MKIAVGIAFLFYAVMGISQTIMAMRSTEDNDKVKWQLHSIKSLGFMILFYLMVVHPWPN